MCLREIASLPCLLRLVTTHTISIEGHQSVWNLHLLALDDIAEHTAVLNPTAPLSAPPNAVNKDKNSVPRGTANDADYLVSRKLQNCPGDRAERSLRRNLRNLGPLMLRGSEKIGTTWSPLRMVVSQN